MRGYLRAMEEAVRAEPGRLVRVWCYGCGIPFLTSKYNQNRGHLRCPTGCWDRHDKADSRRRSVEYYKTDEGRGKKRALNQNRKTRKQPDLTIRAPVLPAILRYYGWLIRMIDDVEFDAAEIGALRETILKTMRQRSRDLHDEVRDNRDD